MKIHTAKFAKNNLLYLRIFRISANSKYYFEKHFTLIELVIASAILLMVVAAVSLSTGGIYSAWAKVVKSNQRLERFIMMDRIADNAFRNAIPFKWIDSNRRERFIFKGDTNELVISYKHRINDPTQGGINFLKLYLEAGKLIAEYRKTPILWWDDDSINTTKEIIFEGVNNISFIYVDIRNDELVLLEDWDEDSAVNIPVGIQIRVDFIDGQSEQWFRRTAGAGFRERFGVRRQNR